MSVVNALQTLQHSIQNQQHKKDREKQEYYEGIHLHSLAPRYSLKVNDYRMRFLLLQCAAQVRSGLIMAG